MIDIKFLRENPEIVKQNIKNKFQDKKLPLVDEVIELDEKARSVQQEADALRANRNKISKQIGALMGQGKKDEAMALKEQVSKDAKKVEELEAQAETDGGCRERAGRYMKSGRLSREIVEAMIDHIYVGKRIPGTKNVPVEIHWDF